MTSKIELDSQATPTLTMDFLTVAQKAAIASYPWIGKGNKIQADGAGTEAMRNSMNLIKMHGTVVIGEGEMDEAPMLFIGEKLGSGEGPFVDIAVDPVEGTTLMSTGQDNALTVIAVAESGTLLHAPDMYMKKMAVGPKAKGCINLNDSLVENMKRIASALNKDVSDLTVMIQERERHEELIEQVLSVDARIKLFSDVDIAGAIATAIDDIEVDLLVGIGGAPEGVISAVALKCLGGDFQAQLLPQNPIEHQRCLDMGISNPHKILTIDDLVKTDQCFFVGTGITDGLLLDGIAKTPNDQLISHSLLCIGGKEKRYQFVKSHH